ncbi:hypothetical protein JRB95_001388 [Listeria monocytogenes]|nr:hypothetical protein [Listeria monocytogenes]
MVEMIGFNGPEPAYMVLWLNKGKQFKTICYSQEELEEAITTHAWKYEAYEVIRNAS